jgi:hypothetical protein
LNQLTHVIVPSPCIADSLAFRFTALALEDTSKLIDEKMRNLPQDIRPTGQPVIALTVTNS